MLPVFEPVLTFYEPVVLGLGVLAAVALAGTAAIVWLVLRADRPAAPTRATVAPIRPQRAVA